MALTNTNGAVVEKYSYDACCVKPGSLQVCAVNSAGGTNPVSTAKREGNRRNPLNWSQPDTRTNLMLDRGYTGHEHLDEAHIINMNGRMYDPIVGRMLSPDPVLQNPYSTQNYNRYSYVMNNPLKYTDPSGYQMSYQDFVTSETVGSGGSLPSWYAGDDFFGGWMPYQESMQYVIDQQNAGNSWVSDGNGGGVWASSDEYITGNAAIGEAMDMGVDIVSNNKGITIHGMMPNGLVTGDIYGTWENGSTFLYSKGSAANGGGNILTPQQTGLAYGVEFLDMKAGTVLFTSTERGIKIVNFDGSKKVFDKDYVINRDVVTFNRKLHLLSKRDGDYMFNNGIYDPNKLYIRFNIMGPGGFIIDQGYGYIYRIYNNEVSPRYGKNLHWDGLSYENEKWW